MSPLSLARSSENFHLPGFSIIDKFLGYSDENSKNRSRARHLLYYTMISTILLIILTIVSSIVLITLSQKISVTGNHITLIVISLLSGGCALLWIGSIISLLRTRSKKQEDNDKQIIESKTTPTTRVIILLAAAAVCISADVYWLQHSSQISLIKGYPQPTVSIQPLTQTQTYTMETPIRFTARGQGHDLTYTWYFKAMDTEQAAGTSILHTFKAAGQYTITVKATDGIGQSSTQTTSIQVVPPTPEAYFVARLFDYYYPYQVEFDASNTKINPDIAAATYSWDFGDGQQLQNQLVAEAAHKYAHDGKYTVKLTVRDEYGQVSTYSSTFVVTKLPPMVHDDN